MFRDLKSKSFSVRQKMMLMSLFGEYYQSEFNSLRKLLRPEGKNKIQKIERNLF